MLTTELEGWIVQAAEAAGLDPRLLRGLVLRESRGNPQAISPAGAIGLTQLMPGTARELGVDPHDPWQNLQGGARYLATQLEAFDEDVRAALAAYNAGPRRTRETGWPMDGWFDRLPHETREYVPAVLRLAGLTGDRPPRRPGGGDAGGPDAAAGIALALIVGAALTA